METKIMRKISKLLIATVIVLAFNSVTIFAATTTEGNYELKQISENTVMVSDDSGESKVIITENQDEIVTQIVPMVGNGEEGYFYVDKEAGTLYSSFTGKTLTKGDISQLMSSPANDENQIQPYGVVGTTTKSISYATMSDIVTATSSAASIAGAILTILGWLGLTAVNPVAGVVSIIGGIVTAIQIGLGNKSSAHGVKVKMNKNEIIKHQAGQTFTTYNYTITSISRY